MAQTTKHKSKTIKLLEENIRVNCHDLRLNEEFSDIKPKV